MTKKSPFYILIACIEIFAIICVVFFITKGAVEKFVQEPSTQEIEESPEIQLEAESLEGNNEKIVEETIIPFREKVEETAAQIQSDLAISTKDDWYKTDGSREQNLQMLLEHRKQEDIKSEKNKLKALAEWEIFTKKQPHELKVLFSDDKSESAWQIGQSYVNKGYYLQHFEEGSSKWGVEAISALSHYLSSQAYADLVILRVDCRSSMCEFAGVIRNIEIVPPNYANSLSMLAVRWEDITRNMTSSTDLMRLFELRGQANFNYALPDEAGVFSIPFSVFLYRNYKASPNPNL